MGLTFSSFLLLHFLCFLCFSGGVLSDASHVFVKLLKMPHAVSNRKYASFSFQVYVNDTGGFCNRCPVNCKLDNGSFSPCEDGQIRYTGLADGNHSFEACSDKSSGAACTSYNWIVDTVNPTAHIMAATSFTNGTRVPVNIFFSEPCDFACSSVNTCNLLVYGAGEVIPTTLNVLEPNMKYSIVVGISDEVQYGRLILVMDKNFCEDAAGNKFTRTAKSRIFIHYDRRSVYAQLRIHVPEKQLQINSEERTVFSTNKIKNLKVYLYFNVTVMNSSNEILSALNVNEGSLVPISGSSFGLRRFGYQLANLSDLAIVTVSLNSNFVISRQGTPVSPVSPVTFLYDSQRPTVRLTTTCRMRTREKSIPVVIRFLKPVFGFNASGILISGEFYGGRRSFSVHIEANSDHISVFVPENVTTDIAGNRNKQSNTLQLKHYSAPLESSIISSITTAAFSFTASISGLLAVSSSSLLSAGAFTKPSSILCSDPARNIFRIASYFQVFTLTRWLGVALPIEYYELVRGLQWTIPYISLPWESGKTESVIVGSVSSKVHHFRVSKIRESIFSDRIRHFQSNDSVGKVFGLPLSPMEYRSYFESQTILPEAEYMLDPYNSHGWKDFSRIMLWLAVIGGSLILLHTVVICILRFRMEKTNGRNYGSLVFPRFEIFLLILALPSACAASVILLKGGTNSGMIVGVLILSLVAILMVSLLFFLSYGISLGKFLQYKEVHQVGMKSHWYHEIFRVTLGPGKRSQWTWKNQPSSPYLAIFGPLFEDLRGPPKYMLSQIGGGTSSHNNERIVDSDDETEDSEAPCIQKLFGILRIYYTLIDCAKRLVLGILAGFYSDIWLSRVPTITLLSITCFQLFFILLKKPFIKRNTQLVEIISVFSEAMIFLICLLLLLLDHEFSTQTETKLGIIMCSIFCVVILAQLINQWYALYRYVTQFDPISGSFSRGLSTASIGLFLLLCPRSTMQNIRATFPLDNEAEEKSRRGPAEKQPWLKNIRELARSSFKDGNPEEASTSRGSCSGFWNRKQAASDDGTCSGSTPGDQSKPRKLYKELEEIFASK